MRIHELFLLTTHWNQWCSNCVSSSTQRSVRFVVAVESNTNDSGSIPKSHTLLIFISEETEATPWPSLYAGVRVNRHGIYPTTIMAEATRQRHLHNSADFTPPNYPLRCGTMGARMGVGWVESGTEKNFNEWTLKKNITNFKKKIMKKIGNGVAPRGPPSQNNQSYNFLTNIKFKNQEWTNRKSRAMPQ